MEGPRIRIMYIPSAKTVKIAVIGTYMPRQCGIATYTSDFCAALAMQYPQADIFAIAVTDIKEGYAYPREVRFEINEQDRESYRQAAEYLNLNDVDIVVLQHEYGVYGGEAGEYILLLLDSLRMPIVTVLHTVLDNPDTAQRRVMSEIARISERLVVMGRHAVDTLSSLYNVPTENIAHIPHGIPDVPFVDPNYYKDQFDADGKTVLLTFGLLSPNKGIEHVISAMPSILERFPDMIYIVLGATHPTILRRDGEAYRHQLQQLAGDLGVAHAVSFHNAYVQLDDLTKFIGAADIYLTPYLNREQITSGTLAYAVGAGKAVISTPYWHAEELLGGGRGILVPFHDPSAIAEKVIWLLDHDAERNAMRKRAYHFGRETTWQSIAIRCQTLFAEIRAERAHAPRSIGVAGQRYRLQELPPIRLSHLHAMTDDTGLLQHATFSVPNFAEGYSIDDNARGLIGAIMLNDLGLGPVGEGMALARRYFAYLSFAFNETTNRFRNFLSYDRRWLDDVGSEDSQARALWALGTVIGRANDSMLIHSANELFQRALHAVTSFTALRSQAFAMLGIHEYLKRFASDRDAQRILDILANGIMDAFDKTNAQNWKWFEEHLTYDNATLPRALLLAGRDTRNKVYVDVGVAALAWLMEIQTVKDSHFVPIGCHGFYPQYAERARFDQQPIEAYSTLAACLDAGRITGDAKWQAWAQSAFDWFLGQNDLAIPLVDIVTGACYDGLQPNGVNQNQGAESTLAYLLSLMEMYGNQAQAPAERAVDEVARFLASDEMVARG